MDALVCPTCGSTFWRRIESGTYTEEAWIDTADMTVMEYDDLEQSMMEALPWTCANDHEASEDIADALEDLR